MNPRNRPRHALCQLVAMALVAAHACAAGAATKVWTGPYVPPPKPAYSKITLGTYVFPGWYRGEGRGDYPYRTHDEDSEWRRCVVKVPKPRPLLGFYDDSLPEVNDWHITWALDHGISYFAFDWYWNAGEHRLLRTLERGFLKAKYAPQMKFCIHWCNHGLDWRGHGWGKAKLDFSRPALVAMTEYLADHYFKLPNYLTIDGRPVLMVFRAGGLIKGNGGPAAFRASLDAMNQVLRARGLKDLYLVGRAAREPIAKAAGVAATTCYGYASVEPTSAYTARRGLSVPYQELVARQQASWRRITTARDLPNVLAMSVGWDDRPRAREKALVFAGKTPQSFKRLCASALENIDPRTNMAVIATWNEWGEGSFLEPDKQWGFAFLDAVRDTFTDAPPHHTDYAPSQDAVRRLSLLSPDELAKAAEAERLPEIQLPTLLKAQRCTIDKPLPKRGPLKGWEFDTASAEGWRPANVEPLTVANGVLATTVTRHDPHLVAWGIGVPAADLACIAVRLRASKTARTAQLFWAAAGQPKFTEGASFTFALADDGGWHTYQIAGTMLGRWMKTPNSLRLDVGEPGDKIEIDWIRIYALAPPAAER